MALFLKYRPQTFADLVGQESVKKTLENALKAERPAHAYLFSGSRGTGKTSTARIFAKGLNCTNLKDGNPCGECEFCVGTAEGTLVDVVEIDAASNRGIDEIRDLREKIMFAPSRAKRKVYIIDEVHMLTKEAFNALLKTLEEPPDHAFFCLATTEIHKIPETILSRCQVFIFQRFTQDQLVNRLSKICDQEGITYEANAIDIIARKAEGGMRDAISLLEQIAAETNQNITEEEAKQSLGISSRESLEGFYQALTQNQTQAALDILKDCAQKGQDFRTFGHDFLSFLREQMFGQLDKPELPKTLQIIEEIEKALSRLKSSPIIELPLEIAVINITQTPAVATNTTPVAAKPVQTPPPQTPAPTVAPTPAPTAPPENTPAPTPAPVASAPAEPAQFSVEGVQKAMSDIVDRAGIPIFAKKSFLTTVPEIEGHNIIFCADSEFHREKLVEPSVSSKILGACKTVLQNEDITIEFIKKMKNKPKAPVSSTNSTGPSADDFLVF